MNGFSVCVGVIVCVCVCSDNAGVCPCTDARAPCITK